MMGDYIIDASNFKSGSLAQKGFAADILSKTYEAASAELRNLEIRKEREGQLSKKGHAGIERCMNIMKQIESLKDKKMTAKSVIEASVECKSLYTPKSWKIDFDRIQ